MDIKASDIAALRSDLQKALQDSVPYAAENHRYGEPRDAGGFIDIMAEYYEYTLKQALLAERLKHRQKHGTLLEKTLQEEGQRIRQECRSKVIGIANDLVKRNGEESYNKKNSVYIPGNLEVDAVVKTSGTLIVGGTIRGTVEKADLVITHNVAGSGSVKSETDIHASGRVGGVLDAKGFIRAKTYTENVRVISGKTIDAKGSKVDKSKLLADYDISFHPLFSKKVAADAPYYVRFKGEDDQWYWIGNQGAIASTGHDKVPRSAKAFEELQDSIKLEPLDKQSSFLPDKQQTIEVFVGKNRAMSIRINAEMTELIQRVCQQWLHDGTNQIHEFRSARYAADMYHNDGRLHSYQIMRGDLNYVARRLFWERHGRKCENYMNGLRKEAKRKPVIEQQETGTEGIKSSFTSATPEVPPYDFFSKDAVEQQAKGLNPQFQSSIMQWGKKLLEHASASYVREQSQILNDYKAILPNIAEILGDINQATLGYNSNGRFRILSRLFGGSASSNTDGSFEKISEALGRLTDALIIDSDNHLQMLERTEKARQEIDKYGNAIELHHNVIDRLYRTVLESQTTNNGQTGNGETFSRASEPKQDVRKRLKDRCDEIELGHQTWLAAIGTMDMIVEDITRNTVLVESLKKHISTNVMERVREGIRQEQRRSEIKLSRMETAAKRQELEKIEQNLKDIARVVSEEISGIDTRISAMKDNVLLLENGRKTLAIEPPEDIALLPYYEPEA